ncbi:MAG TPA: DUF4159 domain-containing protein [Acidobacteriota bacterium]|jgi:hypothetical protein|nr:DUF4159 domain-containing protein [Acidobacteriota bacterium]
MPKSSSGGYLVAGKYALLMLFTVSCLVLPCSSTALTDRGGQRAQFHPSGFTFTRLVYSSSSWRGNSWATDYPKADTQLVYELYKFNELSFVRPESQVLSVDDPELFHYPFLYAVEVGYMYLSDEEARRLREYLLRGGFLVVDDFHGTYEWQNFYQQIKKVFPEYEPQDLDISHPIFHCYYDIQKLIQIPGIQFLRSGHTWEKDGYTPHFMGISDKNGRLLVMINYNVDLGDAWEWAEIEEYPQEYVRLAFQLASNYIVYSMTH